MSGWFRLHRSEYPDKWEEIATRIKELAGWRCEACDLLHGPPPHVLTVHHTVVSSPAECSDWNLTALCQVCHLRAHALRPRPETKADCIERLRRRYEQGLGQVCLPLRVLVIDVQPAFQFDLFVMPAEALRSKPLTRIETIELAQLSLPIGEETR